ncbi:phosphotransferase family protein [Novosphingobium lentum]|uniref:phosphotransferase family protein n=1 Tax=Novosphingobium lentum TaxID=145287 RepID=UPI000A074672|nr:phosphotransferase family protein [Novosphingobium lentum]
MAAVAQDLTAFCDWLDATGCLGPHCAVVGIKQPKTGFSADTLLLEIATDAGPVDIVLRIERIGRHMFLDSSMERQARMMDLLAQSGVPVPTVLGWSTDLSIVGAPFLVMRACAGVSLPQHPSYHVAGPLMELAPSQRAHAWNDALAVMARINRIDWRAGGGFLMEPAYGAPGLDHYLGWISAWRNMVCPAGHAVIDAGIAYLRDNQPSGTPAELLWGDSNAGNFLFGANGAVTAALDFEAAAIGPAEIDLGWWFVVERMLAAGHPLPAGMPDRAQQIAQFESALGRSVQDLPYYEVLAALRMALVMARTGGLLIQSGALAADNQVGLYNPAATMLAAMIDRTHDDRLDHYFAMVMTMNAR